MTLLILWFFGLLGAFILLLCVLQVLAMIVIGVWMAGTAAVEGIRSKPQIEPKKEEGWRDLYHPMHGTYGRED